ncbi:MAG: DUF3786 domain-containing protein [Coriobacteriales bacterium]|jgi:hypothetical protein|nr:DUF3786 domain-containing protein [Coriobacteriales bacterium]
MPEQIPSGYDQIYTSLLPRLADCDIVAQARQLGLTPEGEDAARAEFLGRHYLITNQGVDTVDGGPQTNINNRSLLIYYILAKGGIEPKFSFVPVGRLTGMPSGTHDGKGEDEGWFICEALLRDIQGQYNLFVAAAEELNGEYIGILLGGHCWQFMVLPKIPMRMIFYEADEEFPAELQAQFDETAPYYMDFECLAFLSGSVMRELCSIARQQKQA